MLNLDLNLHLNLITFFFLIFGGGENGVIRGSEGRASMDRLNRAGLNFDLAGSVRPETDYFFSRFFFFQN